MSTPPQIILDLIERYGREKSTLQSSSYGEADTRKEFIEPLFTSLGWDVSNTAMYAEAYKDVVNEYSLKIGTTHKAPDYAFRVGGTRKFFVEAKRPGIDISTDSAPAYQLRRYGWTAKLPVSILINFRYIAVYDCAKPPRQSDKASVARTLLIQWIDLATKWGDLCSLLGKDAVYKGSLDRYAAGATRRRGTSLVDDEFLRQMEQWRNDLAHNLALRNSSLTVAELNESVQQTLDRLIFLRIAEDRGIELYGGLKDQVRGAGVYKRLMDMFHTADLRYNSGLFHFRLESQISGPADQLTPYLKVDDKILRTIVNSMYYPESPYEFSVFPADILGQVYEQFLGKVIRLTTSHEARIEDKPEVKKAGGVYYTPTNIVAYIVEKTLTPVLADKTPRSALNIRILDPACGSGSFLIGAYDYLINWFTESYVREGPENRPRSIYRSVSGEWHLTLAERKRILTSCIYGVDIDRQAVEVTKLSLMLKVLEDESNETINSQAKLFNVERVLPDLDRNIHCGNSLVGSDVQEHLILTSLEEVSLNPFDWKAVFPTIMGAGGFHIVIGNPPYDVLEKARGAASWPHALLRDYLPYREDYSPALGGKLNLYRIFLIRAIELARSGGSFGMIVPMSLVGDISTTATRQHILSTLNHPALDCFPQKDNPARRVFKRAKLSTTIITGVKSTKKLGADNKITTRVFPGNDLQDKAITNTLTVADCTLLDPKTSPIPLTDHAELNLCRKIHGNPLVKRIDELADSYIVTRGEINQTIYGNYITTVSAGHEALLKGVEVGAFEINTTLSQGGREWLDVKKMRARYPRKTSPSSPRIATQRITGVDERQRLVVTLVTHDTWFADSTNSISPNEKAPLDLRYLVAVLNSDLMQWRFRLTSTNNNVGTNELLALPIRIPAPDSADDNARYKAVIDAGQRISTLKASLISSRSVAEKSMTSRWLEAAWDKLNQSVADFYGLDEYDRELIANRLTKVPTPALSDIDGSVD